MILFKPQPNLVYPNRYNHLPKITYILKMHVFIQHYFPYYLAYISHSQIVTFYTEHTSLIR